MDKKLLAVIPLAGLMATGHAQTVTHYVTVEGSEWQAGAARLSARPKGAVVAAASPDSEGTPFQAWGTTFNELDLDAYNLLTDADKETVMKNLYSPDGDLRFTHGRVSMNANDYARAWYSCSEVPGDFDNRYFNIDHDKSNIILLAKDAQRQYPALQLFMSPWSPPAWMKINNDYCVQSSGYNDQDPRKDYLLFAKPMTDEKLMGEREGVYPRRLATQDFFIQDPRYLECYADQFCRFIDLYKAEGLPITKVMYQNEAYSYTIYPGCAWTAEGTIRFNNDFLAPALRERHPEVELWMGTVNTNRLDYLELTVDGLKDNVKGIGTQWECRENLPALREKYPDLRLMMSESECGGGNMAWADGEHTFFLLSDNLGNGVDEYYNWNFILKDHGESTWGWTQNALIQVDSATGKPRYTAEYYAYKHFSHFIRKGTKMVGYAGRQYSQTPVVVFRDGDSFIVTAGNFTDKVSELSVKLGKKYLNIKTKPHSFNTYVVKI